MIIYDYIKNDVLFWVRSWFFLNQFSPFPCDNFSSRLVPLPRIISKNASMTKGHLKMPQTNFGRKISPHLCIHFAKVHLGFFPPVHCNLTGGTSQRAFLAAWKAGQNVILIVHIWHKDLNTSLNLWQTGFCMEETPIVWIGMDWFRENWRRPIGCLSFKYKRRVPLKRLEVSLVICQLGVWQGTENDNQERF